MAERVGRVHRRASAKIRVHLTLTIVGAAVAFTLGGALWFGLRRRAGAGWAATVFVVVAPVLSAAATATWHTYALDLFVKREAGQLHAIIAKRKVSGRCLKRLVASNTSLVGENCRSVRLAESRSTSQ